MGDSCCSSGILDCEGSCNGFAVVDECGVCGGDDSSCVEGSGIESDPYLIESLVDIV
jgi:hypothetical protein